MCLILFALDTHPRYQLVVAANRDEYYSRPTAGLAWWSDHQQVLAGRDQRFGGTWMGITRQGRIAAVTNYRQPQRHDAEALSRGRLVSSFLLSDLAPGAYLEQLGAEGSRYNGFNLLVGQGSTLLYLSNRGPTAPVKVRAGIHGLSNGLLDTRWPKVRRGKRLLELALRGPEERLVSHLLELLADDQVPADSELPTTGVGLALERALAPIFITTDGYGTRSSQVVLVGRNGSVVCWEQAYQAGQRHQDPIRYRFRITAAGVNDPAGGLLPGS